MEMYIEIFLKENPQYAKIENCR